MSLNFDQFLEFCKGNLSSSKQLLKLVKKRYKECNDSYKNSESFFNLVLVTEAKIASDKARIFVHIKDFLQKLKEGNDQYSASSNEGPNKGAGACSKRDLPCSSSEAESDTNPAKRRRTNEGTTDRVRSGKSCTNSEDESDNDWKVKVKTCEENLSEATDNVQQDDNDKNICSVVEDSGTYESCANVKVDSYERESDPVPDANLNEKENSTEIKETQSGEHYRITELITASNKMYSTSEDDSDKDTDVTKHIADIIQQGDEDENDSKKDSEMEKHSDGKDIINDNAVTEESCKTSDSKKTGKVKLNCASYDLWEESKKNKSNDNETNNPIVDQTKPLNHEHENHKRDEAAESDDGNKSDSSLEECSVLENTPMSKSDKSNAQSNSKHSNSYKDETKKDEDVEIEEREKEERKNEEHSDGVGEESDDVHMISDDDEKDTETDKKLMLDKTQNFVNGEKSNEDFAGYDADKENKNVAGVRNISSSDEEDPEYAAKAKKFREKCKKKYVIHTGSKKRKNTETSPPTTSNNELKKCKKKKPRSPRSPRSPRKSSPNKSSILIITDSESETDQESCPKSVSKLVDEKIVNHFKKELDIDIVYPKVVVNKVKIKEELLFDQLYKVKESDHDETGDDDDEKMDYDSNVHPLKHSEKTINGNLDNDVESDHKFQEKSKTKDSPKVKKRVNFTSEKLLTKGEKTENKDSDTEIPQATTSCAQSKVWHKIKDRDKLSDNEENDDANKPRTSTADDREAARRKKGSEKQIRKLEKLLEQIRDQIEEVRARELSVDELDSEISDYILEDKLQRKFMKVWDKLCELHQAVKTTGRPTDKYFKYQGTRYPDINRKIEKFINKKKVFPDFHDIRGIINKVNKDKRLHLKSKEIDDISKEAFTDVGNKLQKRRQKDFVATFQGAEVNAFSLYDDPALYDPNLKKKLDSNKKAAKHMMDQVVEKYAALQYKVDDKTDDDDDDEDDDDDNVDTNTGAEDFDRLLAGVDNSDSDNNDSAKCGLNNSNESGPCLEIENVESGSRSRCPPSIPLHKLGQSVKQAEKLKLHHDNPKSQHFADQLGLGMKRTTPENSITILSDDDDDNEVKCNGDTAAIELEVDYPDLPESDIDDDDYIDEQFTKPHMNEAITIITDDEDEDIGIVNETGDQTVQEEEEVVKKEEMETSVTEDPFELKIAYARHVSIDELDKIHKEGISRKSDEGLSNEQCENVKGPGELEIEEIDREIDGLLGVETANSEHVDLIPDIDTSCEAATVISSLESSLELDVAKSEKVDSVKKCVSENLTANDTGTDLEVICVENDKRDIKAASSSGEKQVIKSSADEVKPKFMTPEVVVLESVDIIEPKPLTSKDIDSSNINSNPDIFSIDSQTDGAETVKATDIDKVESDNILDVDNDDVLVATKLEISSDPGPGLKCVTPDENNMETIRGELPVDENLISGESQSLSDIFASIEEENNGKDGSDGKEVVENKEVCENQNSQEEHMVEGQSESVPDIFASDDNCDLNDDQDEDTISEVKEVLDNPVLAVDENHVTKDIKSDTNSIELKDFVTCRTKTKDETSDNDRIETKDKDDKTVTNNLNSSPCDLDKTTTSVDNIKKKLISLGSAITKQSPTVTLQGTSTSSQDKSKIIDPSKPSTSASLWSDYDENAGLIETYKEPEISKSLTIITEDIIAISSDSDSD